MENLERIIKWEWEDNFPCLDELSKEHIFEQIKD